MDDNDAELLEAAERLDPVRTVEPAVTDHAGKEDAGKEDAQATAGEFERAATMILPRLSSELVEFMANCDDIAHNLRKELCDALEHGAAAGENAMVQAAEREAGASGDMVPDDYAREHVVASQLEDDRRPNAWMAFPQLAEYQKIRQCTVW